MNKENLFWELIADAGSSREEFLDLGMSCNIYNNSPEIIVYYWDSDWRHIENKLTFTTTGITHTVNLCDPDCLKGLKNFLEKARRTNIKNADI